MSSNARRMPEINLEDFERKLRAAGSGQGGVEDPLEELTRLVNTIANERPRDERIVDFTTVRPTPRPAPPEGARGGARAARGKSRRSARRAAARWRSC